MALAAIYLWCGGGSGLSFGWERSQSICICACVSLSFLSVWLCCVSCNQPTSSDHKSQMAAATIIDRRAGEAQKYRNSTADRSPKASYVANLGMISLQFESEFVAPAAMPLNCVRIAIGSGKWELEVHGKNSGSSCPLEFKVKVYVWQNKNLQNYTCFSTWMSHWVVRNVWSHQYRLYSITHHLCAHFHRHNRRCPGDASSTADAAIDEWAAGKAQRVPFWAVYPVWNCGIAESYCWVESNGQYPWYQYKKMPNASAQWSQFSKFTGGI